MEPRSGLRRRAFPLLASFVAVAVAVPVLALLVSPGVQGTAGRASAGSAGSRVPAARPGAAPSARPDRVPKTLVPAEGAARPGSATLDAGSRTGGVPGSGGPAEPPTPAATPGGQPGPARPVAPTQATDPPASSGLPAHPPRVLVYGDSLGWESYPYLDADLAAGGAAVTGQTFPMTAICDWLPAMAGMVTQTRPDLLVLVFNGNRRTSCMLGADGQSLAGPALLAKYRRDALTAIGIAARAGAQTLLVGGPVFRTDSAQIGVGRVYADLAARLPGVDYVDAGEVVAPGDRFAERLPCQSIDRGHCDPDGMVAVRSADGIHFCPGQGGARRPCPVWSSGAYRYAAAIEGPAARALGLG